MVSLRCRHSSHSKCAFGQQQHNRTIARRKALRGQHLRLQLQPGPLPAQTTDVGRRDQSVTYRSTEPQFVAPRYWTVLSGPKHSFETDI